MAGKTLWTLTENSLSFYHFVDFFLSSGSGGTCFRSRVCLEVVRTVCLSNKVSL
jgi:hypothetical protein